MNFNQSKDTGLTATEMTRNDDLHRHLIPDSEWPRFLQATVAEWTAILDTSAVTIISPAAAKDIREVRRRRTPGEQESVDSDNFFFEFENSVQHKLEQDKTAQACHDSSTHCVKNDPVV